MTPSSTRVQLLCERFASADVLQIGSDDLKAIVQRFEKLTETNASVSGNKKTVTNNVLAGSEPGNSQTKEIYRLVRLLNNEEQQDESSYL